MASIEILPNIDKQHAISYLQRYCTIDDLDDTIYVKKLGNNKTTFAIDFTCDGEISTIRKINDENGTKLDETVYDECENDPEDDW